MVINLGYDQHGCFIAEAGGEKTGVDYKSLPALETIADGINIQPYYNCIGD